MVLKGYLENYTNDFFAGYFKKLFEDIREPCIFERYLEDYKSKFLKNF